MAPLDAEEILATDFSQEENENEGKTMDEIIFAAGTLVMTLVMVVVTSLMTLFDDVF